MRQAKRALLCLILLAAAAALWRFSRFQGAPAAYDGAAYEAAIRYCRDQLTGRSYSYREYLEETAGIPRAADGGTADPFDPVWLAYGQSVDIPVHIPADGLYHIAADYDIPGDSLTGVTLSAGADGVLPYAARRTVHLPAFYRDETKAFPLDRYGDELMPQQIRLEGIRRAFFYDNAHKTSEPLLYAFTAGEHLLRLSNISAATVIICGVSCPAPAVIPSRAEYTQNCPVIETAPVLMALAAPDYAYKNATNVSVFIEKNPSFARYDPLHGKLNAVGWGDPGVEVFFELQIPDDGLYGIAFHYQNGRERRPAYYTVSIDGEVPFSQMRCYAFPATGDRLGHEILSDETGEAYRFYLQKGAHTLSLRAEREPYEGIIDALQTAVLHMNQFSMDIKKITGKDVDRNRTWRLTRYLPETERILGAYIDILSGAAGELLHMTNSIQDDAVTPLLDAAEAFRRLLRYPDELPLRLDDMTTLATHVADVIRGMEIQPLTLDKLYVFADQDLPPANASLFTQVASSVRELWVTFISGKYTVRNEPDALNVWAWLSPMHLNIMQKMVDSEFTPRTGQKVKISLTPDVDRLVMASAAGQTPDVAVGIWSYIPFDLSSRNALLDLTRFPDYWQVASRVPAGTLPAYCYNEGMYAIPDALDFQVLIYRRDILDGLGLLPPDTWQDVIDMLPVLQRYGLDFYHPIASGKAHKGYTLTTPLIYQHGGALFSQDGLSARISEPEAVRGVKFLGSLFTAYSLPAQVPSFFDAFRKGLIPIGIADASDFNLIRNAAPELAGLWAIAPYPGTLRDGKIDHTNVMMSSGSIIFQNTDKPDAAWEFIKWWTSEDVQSRFSRNLRLTFGDAYMWLSANTQAFIKNAPLDPQDAAVISEQIAWQRDIPRTPGYYELERALSNAWNMMVFDGKPAQVAVDEGTLLTNRELLRKMAESGLCDAEGAFLKPYALRDLDWVLGKLEEARP
jgi:ABC-type glycerol-3-phosphate transport system substrate-binding protein